MIIIIYSDTTEHTIRENLGKSEYSYYFLRKQFLPVLEKIGRVIAVENPQLEVDPIYFEAGRRGEACVFLCFAPPHRTPLGLACPTIPLVAWEFSTIPSETWYYEAEQDWRYALNFTGRAIMSSSDSVRPVKDAMGSDYPVVSIPAPIWDSFAPRYRPQAPAIAHAKLSVKGGVIDSRASGDAALEELLDPDRETEIALDGVVYLTVFNPRDGRKNADDMIDGFCTAFRDVEDATLILKLSHSEVNEPVARLRDRIRQQPSFKCRIVMLTGYLDSESYETLIAAATFAVNASLCEGLCMPLAELMSCGKPALAPRHTAMIDYVVADNAFIVRSSAEPAAWPHDPRYAFRAQRRRIDFESLVEAYRDSHRVATSDPARYAQMSANAHEALRRHCSDEVTVERLKAIFAHPVRPPFTDAGYGRIKTRVDVPWEEESLSGSRCLSFYPPFEEFAFAFARRGMKVEVVGASSVFIDAAAAFEKLYPIDLSLREAQARIASKRQAAYDLIVLGEEQLPWIGLKSATKRLRAMLSKQGKVLVARDPLRTSPTAQRLERLRRRLGMIPRGDLVVRRFANAGFTWKSFEAPLEGRNLTFSEFRR